MSQIVCRAPVPEPKHTHKHSFPPVVSYKTVFPDTTGARKGDIGQCDCGQYAIAVQRHDDYGQYLVWSRIRDRKARRIMRNRGCLINVGAVE